MGMARLGSKRGAKVSTELSTNCSCAQCRRVVTSTTTARTGRVLILNTFSCLLRKSTTGLVMVAAGLTTEEQCAARGTHSIKRTPTSSSLGTEHAGLVAVDGT